MVYVKKISLIHDSNPTDEFYPFNLEIFRKTKELSFPSPVTFFIGDNGSGKSTLLEAVARRCGIHIWDGENRSRVKKNIYEEKLYRHIQVEWAIGPVPGSFFASEIFKVFAANLEEWASVSPGTLDYFGGKSLISQSHGQGHMAYFKNRYAIEGLYLLDEPENALSPARQIELALLLKEMAKQGHAQFIIATHSPILMAVPGATIYSFDSIPIAPIAYTDTNHYKVYKNFINNRESFFDK